MSAVEANVRSDAAPERRDRGERITPMHEEDPAIEMLIAPWKSVLTLWSMPFLMAHALLSASFVMALSIRENPVRRARAEGQMNDAQLPLPETLRNANDRELFA